MNKQKWAGLTLASFSLLCVAHAEAHFRLVQPPSWLNEDSLGGPQKGSPCGPGNAMLILGDDVQPVPSSGAVTTFSAGQKIDLQLEETVYHPGYFRVSLARTKSADATIADFPNPPLTDPVDCHYDRAAVPTTAHDDVLADGLFVAEGQDGTTRSLSQTIELPKEPCDACTLQVVQVMEGHPGSSCFYFHCADIKIVAADVPRPSDAGNTPGRAQVPAATAPSDAGSMSDASSVESSRGATTDATANSDAAARAASADAGGCAIRPVGSHGCADSVWCLLAAISSVLGWRVRRRRTRARELVRLAPGVGADSTQS